MGSQVQHLPVPATEDPQPAAKPRRSKARLEAVPRQPRHYREKEKGAGNGTRVLTRAEIVKKLISARYQKLESRFLVHAFRLAGGSAVQSGVLYSIFLKTITGYRTKGDPQPEYTPPMLDEDYADELGVTKQAVNEAIREALSRQVAVNGQMTSEPLIQRRGDSGPEYYQYKLTIEAWESYHNGFTTRDLTPKKTGEQLANAPETAVSRIQIAAGEKKRFQVGEGDAAITLNCRNACEVPLSIQPTISQPGQVDLDIAPEQTDSSRSPSRGVRAPESNRGRSTPMPSPAHRTPAAAGDLIALCKDLGLAVSIELARRTLTELKDCPLDYFREALADRVARGTNGKALLVGYLPKFAAEQLVKHRAGESSVAPVPKAGLSKGARNHMERTELFRRRMQQELERERDV